MNNSLADIRKSLGRVGVKMPPTLWLDTGIPDLNNTLGHKDYGIAYGRIIEVTGWKSQGKTTLILALAALAQQDKALVIWTDVENSFDPGWARKRGFAVCAKCSGTGLIDKKGTPADCDSCGGVLSPTRGLDTSNFILIQPYVATFSYVEKGKLKQEKEPRVSNAQELCAEAEATLVLPGYGKRILVVDSVAALETAGEADAGLEGSNMRTGLDLPLFMSKLMRRWAGRTSTSNTMLVMVNQLRASPKPNAPAYSPGGNALPFYAHVQARVARAKNGAILDKGKPVGFCGIMKSLKNKTGGTEGEEIGYRIRRTGPLEFIGAKDVRKMAEE